VTGYEASPHDWVADHVERYERTGGREGGEFNGVPCVILTTTGRKSGKTRKTPLVRVPNGNGYLVIASMGGQPKHPVWYLNLVADPEVMLQDGPDRRSYRARVVEGPERDELWTVAVAAYGDYADYQERCDRQIPVVALDPV
jgi:deazaflavin-dependent oxidoreductase (nitroreductase family)